MLLRLLRNFEEIVSAFFLTVVILSVLYGVFSRYVMGHAAAWSNELAAVAFTWTVFIGSAAAFKKGLHIGVDTLMNQLPESLSFSVSLIAQGLLAFFLGYVVFIGFDFSLQSFQQPTSILRLPNTFFYLAVPIGFSLMLLHQVRCLLRLLP
ncbi:MAG TPA: TRAP transporter small permease [SAR324 cluster bacterium]|jgi:TRAP-type C4-dicarboxylate transport system permease small subunit|nr:TRAP transporter small permease [Gammaproteobacteria bacterium]MDP7332410.1 TRAP transporter small permease [SAR324 cluster bacterium]HJO44952.1 TRAP transporter small permease [SAR324 cluster bacterium]|tara:strand:- start:1616 stop:2068 length:453 start_codon:yes stop_codon:yes gene_type:complete